MDEELILQQPMDRRLANVNSTLPPGPPGAEGDVPEFDTKKAPKPPKPPEKETTLSKSSSRRRSPSGSPPPKRKSPGRGRRSPSPRRRRSPSPRRNRFRDYSPDRRGRGMRRSPDRRRSRSPRDRDRRGMRNRYRGGRGRSTSRSRTRSMSPRRGMGGGGGSGRWSPKKKPNSPSSSGMIGGPQAPSHSLNQPPPGGPPTQYNVMPQMYGDAYGASAYNQYGVPPPAQQGFPPPTDAYGMPSGGAAQFNTAFPPPPAWNVNDAYSQQTWLPQTVPDPNQMSQMPPAPVTTAPPPPAVVATQSTISVTSKTTGQNMSALPDAAPGTIEPNPTHDAVAQEAENQRDELKKQRASYLKKTALLKKELKMLKEQRKDLNAGDAPPSPTTKGFIDENEKLQNQIEKKLVTIENVIDMLTGIIGEENLDQDPIEEQTFEMENNNTLNGAKMVESNAALGGGGTGGAEGGGGAAGAGGVRTGKKKRKSSTESSSESSSSTSSSSDSSTSSDNEDEEDDEDDEDESSSERLKYKAMESMKSKQKDAIKKEQIAATKLKEEKIVEEKKRFNYVFYDPEMHWCQTCDVFPKTAKDYLNHLHTKEHINRESIETPWHSDMVNDQYPVYEGAPVKRTPIRGLTFFVPATAWFCKLCNIWMGDLHCASTHLKSQLHSNKYNIFLEKNPHFEVNWLADRQRVLNEKKSTPLPPQITSVSTTAADNSQKKSKKEDEKAKKRKKKSSEKKDKKKKKKKQRSKKRKRNNSTSTSSSSDSSTSDSESPKKPKSPVIIKELDNANPAASIRVAMRKQEPSKPDEMAIDEPPPPPPMIASQSWEIVPPQSEGRLGKWTVAQEGVNVPPPAAGSQSKRTANVTAAVDEDNKRDDAILQQWNTVQPVISESEKKLLEQLKGKLKNKPKEEAQIARNAGELGDRERERDKRDNFRRRDVESDRNRRRSRSPAYGGRIGRSRSRGRRSRSRSRGGWIGRRRRTRSRSRRRSRSFDRRRRLSRSRSRSMRRRSRSHDRRRRNSRSRTRSRTRSRSASRNRIEKPVIKHSEFRPRVPEKDKERDKKSTDSKDKKDSSASSNAKKSKSSNSSNSNNNVAGKKLPFIGKMPVFKKQTSGQAENGEKRVDDGTAYVPDSGNAPVSGLPQYSAAMSAAPRPPVPTAAQIQMAMMEDVYGNAPPFHPDAGMMMDYDDLMPDPVQFVNLMGQAPPPPPPANQSGKDGGVDAEDDGQVLPPGIDETESEEFVPKPLSDASMPRKGPLPKDLEEALNIIFPGEKKDTDGESDDATSSEAQKMKSSGETQIITDEPIMQVEDLKREGIHMVTIEETSLAAMDDASQLSMNEPLVFNKPGGNNAMSHPMSHATIPRSESTTVFQSVSTNMLIEDSSSQNAADLDLHNIEPPPPPQTRSPPTPATTSNSNDNPSTEEDVVPLPVAPPSVSVADTADIPMPHTPIDLDNNSKLASEMVYDLDDIPQPPASPTDSEKHRRQEELDDLAMLGIDADDMAAQRM